jgi:hypothetical protein
MEKELEPYASRARACIFELIDERYEGNMSEFSRRTGVEYKSLERWKNAPELGGPSLNAVIRVAYAEKVSLDWMIFGLGSKNAPPDVADDADALKLWECVERMVNLPADVRRDEAHYLLPAPSELIARILVASEAYVAQMYSLVREYHTKEVSLRELFARRRLPQRGREVPLTIVFDGPLESSD